MGDYPQSCYTEILKAYQKLFGIANGDLDAGQWIYNRRKIKAMFDDGFLIVEILGAFKPACERGKWPAGTPFFQRVHDVLLARRREAKSVRITGIESINETLRRRLTPQP